MRLNSLVPRRRAVARWAAALVVAATTVVGTIEALGGTAGALPPKPPPFVLFGTLIVLGDFGGDQVTLRVPAADLSVLQIDHGDDQTADFTVKRSRFTRVFVETLGGDDLVRVDETGATFTDVTPTVISTGSGADLVSGGIGAEVIVAGAGKDFVSGRGGNDHAFLGAGDDEFQWDAGDGSDAVFGDSGHDTFRFNGDGADETFAISADGERARLARDAGGFVTHVDAVEQVELAALEGADNLMVHDLSGTDVRTVNADLSVPAGSAVADGQVDGITVAGTPGDDVVPISGAGGSATVAGLAATVNVIGADPGLDRVTVNGLGGADSIDAADLAADAIGFASDGGDGDDVIVGSGGNDFVDGGSGDDIALLGAGDDAFQWDPGEGSDGVEGQGGHDVMLFNGNGANERFEAVANASRVRFTRDVGTIVMDLDDVEQIDLDALDGRDTVVVHDLSGTDLQTLNTDLEAVPGSGVGDSQTDFIAMFGTPGDDAITVSGAAGSSTVSGLVPTVNVTRVVYPDVLSVVGQAGNDTIDASGLAADGIGLGASGGDGDDRLFGGAGQDSLDGGDGNDFADGNGDADSAFMGDGNDTFQWDPGEGSDTVEGQNGFDVMVFNGSGADERFEASANGPRLTFTRDVGGIVMDLDDVEEVELDVLGGRDTLVVNDLTGTDLQELDADLEAVEDGGDPDTETDFITVVGTPGDDFVDLLASGQSVFVLGPTPFVSITAASSQDVLQVLGQAGGDRINASSLRVDSIGFGASGDDGDDQLTGGDGADSLNGGNGADFVAGNGADDSVFTGDGDDIIDWAPGDGSDIVSGEAGFDALRFSGSSANEQFAVSADGFGGATLTRDLDHVTMSLDRVEAISVLSFGGADTLLVGDLSDFRGTGLEAINASFFDFGVPGGQTDVLSVTGTESADAITVAGNASTASVRGLPVRVDLTGVEPSDRLEVNSLGGDDTVDSTGLAPNGMRFLADAGDGNDTLLGGAGDEVLAGGDGADVVFGGSGDNVLFGNAGDDVLRGEEGDDFLDGGDGDDVLIGGAGDDVLLNGEVVFDD